jgi:hypothetical protein
MNYSLRREIFEFITQIRIRSSRVRRYHQTTSVGKNWKTWPTTTSLASLRTSGNWTNDFSGSLSYVNAKTGASAGTDTHASIENFIRTWQCLQMEPGRCEWRCREYQISGEIEREIFVPGIGKQHFQISKKNPGP